MESPGIPASMRITVSAIHWWEQGFDVICHATNHAMDKGRAGLVNCAEYWRDEYPQITVLGIHDTADTSTSCGADPAIIELGDMRIAVLNYTYGTNGISLPADMPYAVDLLNEEQVAADIQRAEELADFTIVWSALGNGVQADIRCFAGEMDQDIRGKRCGSDPGYPPACH